MPRMQWLRNWLCRQWGHRWGTEPGQGATCTRCGYVSKPWADLVRLEWQRRPVKVTATLTEARQRPTERPEL